MSAASSAAPLEMPPDAKPNLAAARAGRVVTLPPGGRFVVDLALEVLATSDHVAEAEAEIRRVQAHGGPATINPRPLEPFAPEPGQSRA